MGKWTRTRLLQRAFRNCKSHPLTGPPVFLPFQYVGRTILGGAFFVFALMVRRG